MFDISFGELILAGAVALVVIGPEKLPKVARTAGMLFGRAQRMAAGFRADLERELQASEIAELQKKISEEANNLRDEMAESAAQVRGALEEEEHPILPPPVIDNTDTEPPSLPAASDAPKPRQRRKPAKPKVEADGLDTSPASADAAVAAEEAKPSTPKKPRKRKTTDPQADLFQASPAATDSANLGDRR